MLENHQNINIDIKECLIDTLTLGIGQSILFFKLSMEEIKMKVILSLINNANNYGYCGQQQGFWCFYFGMFQFHNLIADLIN